MTTNAEVWLWGTRIGYVHMETAQSAAAFEYDKAFLASGIEVSPLQMPLSDRVYTFPELAADAFHGVPGLLADSLPDRFGNAVIDKWLVQIGRAPESFSAVERLCYTGKRGMGALEYVPATGPAQDKVEPVDVDALVKFASEILSAREEISVSANDISIEQLLKLGTSAGGARAKAIIAWNETTGEIRSGQVNAGKDYTYWLMKFDGVNGNGDRGEKDKPEYTLIEYAYHLMAQDAGIRMNECRIFEHHGLHHFMTKRFDREADGKKLHMQTLAALAHIDYNIPCLCGYEQAAFYARQLGCGMSDVEQLFRRMVFNVLTVNQDDHVKNFSFLMDRRGQWSLAPAYDLTFAYSPHNRWLAAHQMTVNGKNKDIEEADILIAGKNMGLSSRMCKNILDQVKNTTSDWEKYADKCGIREQTVAAISNIIRQETKLSRS